jgi:hypothetical protein
VSAACLRSAVQVTSILCECRTLRNGTTFLVFREICTTPRPVICTSGVGPCGLACADRQGGQGGARSELQIARSPIKSTDTPVERHSAPQRAGVQSPGLLLLGKDAMNRLLVVALSCFLFSSAAPTADPGCEAQATEKKLSRAAKSSFITKCQKDAAAAATATCETQAAEKKLAGAAKNSFVKKCEKDAAAAH